METNSKQRSGKGFFNFFLDGIEKIGNKLPHPVTLFALFALAVIIISEISSRAGLTVDFYDAKSKAQKTVEAVSLLNAEGLRYMINSATQNFTSFHPLGTVLVAMLGVGVAEGTGLINASLKKLVLSTPKKLITAVVVFAGVMSNIASDAGYVVLVPLGAIVFLSFKRHPLAGLAAAFAGVSGGFSANLLLGTLDPLLAGITNEALSAGGIDASILPTSNYYFMVASTVLITFLGTIVTEKIVEPRLGEYKGQNADETMEVTKEEKKGLVAAGLSILVFIGVFLLLMLPENAILKVDGSLKTFTSNGLVPVIMLFFLIPGLVYGITSGTIKSDKDVVKFMGKSMSNMGGYLVLVFFAAQFIKYFSYTNLGIILAVSGANFLESVGFVGLPLIISFIVVAGFINLFIGSASAKWGIMAPVFVPMMYKLGFTPEFTQLAYRIGDSCTNIITPLMSYFAVIVIFAKKYDEDTGIGTLISTMLPYSLIFLVGWTLLLTVWYFLGLPIGPEAFINL
ncbi:AbgT family transporter [Maledivibacter halophilus]|uniref:Aminobenzoyl-glutamate transport protein n=1 Tax=Maledivibacter halophilus TaxID=36842 RepID=A0A1T5JY96_9FIRM|nr:AbgT family transporter [Maledivibacter halophilus]SKC56188.1 aminobenzoyl-glutamate transport protein [Maledivibacter halophilus]